MTQVKIRDINPAVGAEVEGFDPMGQHDDATWRLLSKTLSDRAVLVFRDVKLDTQKQHDIAEILFANGEVSKATLDRNERFSYVSNKEPDGGSPYGRLLFHTDMMWSELADQIATLYGVEVEQPSTPTIFTSTAYAWKTLPDELKKRVEGLKVFQQNGPQGRGDHKYQAEIIQPIWDKFHDIVTPIAHKHPRTGETLLYVSEQHSRYIVGMDRKESDALLDTLFEHIYRPEVLMEHRWRKGDYVVWDNMIAQHARPNLMGSGPPRTLRKIHAPGDIGPRFSKATSYAKRDETASAGAGGMM
jgi:alpha-ketoglutarate-dependent taurine dioxygenase